MIVTAIGLLLLLGLASQGSLVMWTVGSFVDYVKLLHALTGFFTALMLAWYFGKAKIRWGLVTTAVSIVLGGAGEPAQEFFSMRGGERDFFLHGAGSLVAMILYVLVVTARWCESPDAVQTDYSAYSSRP